MNGNVKTPETELLCDLVQRQSITPEGVGCQAVLIERLEACRFDYETMVFGEITNLWAWRGTESPVLCFVGHADVVPTGNLAVWKDQYVVHPFPAPYR